MQKFTLIAAFSFLTYLLQAQKNHSFKNIHTSSNNPALLNNASKWQQETNLLFIENKGQVTDAKGNAASDILFTAKSGNTRIMLTNNAIHYQFTQVQYPQGFEQNERIVKDLSLQKQLRAQLKTSTYHFSVELQGANAFAKVLTQDKTDYTENFFLAHCSNRIIGVRSYKKIIYQNIYPGIDWVIYTNGNNMKYDFIVKPGANASLIKLKVNNAVSYAIDKNGELVITTNLGEVREKAPESFIDGKKVASHFKQNSDGSIGFDVLTQHGKTLIIDPNIVWATYYGGTEEDYGNAVSRDANGNIYFAGYTKSTSNIASNGYQNFHGGSDLNFDAFLVKFSNTGSRLWATYYGNSGDEYCNAVATDASGNIYLAGYTNSTTGITTTSAFQVALSGGNDVFIVKFNSLGNTRMWATYFGGTLEDRSSSITTDASGNVYLAGGTQSTNNISFNGFQNTFGGGVWDAFFVKFSSTGSRLLASYYGSTGEDYGSSINVLANGNIYFTGNTSSTSGIATIGQTISGGSYDAFIVKFSDGGAGSRLWSSYLGGSGDDIGYALASDASSNVYLVGWTNSASGIATGGFQNTFGGSNDGYLAKFNSAGAKQWATYYGGSQNDYGTAICTDACDNVYLTGFTASTFSIASGGFQNGYGGGASDVFLAKFNSVGSRLWGSYYGGSGDDLCYSICNDTSSNAVYLAGYTSSASGIANSGFQNSNAGGAYDAFLCKINYLTITPGSIPAAGYCPGYSFSLPNYIEGCFKSDNVFTAQLSDASGSFTNPTNVGTLTDIFGNISITLPPTLTTANGYKIRVVSSSPAFTGSSSTAFEIYSIPPAPVVSVVQPTCTVATGMITVTPSSLYSYFSLDGTNYVENPIFSNVVPGFYEVRERSLYGCTSPATVVTIIQATPAAPSISVTQPTSTVATGTITVTNPTGTGLEYSINGTSYQTSTTFTNVTPGTYNVTVKNTSTGCVSTATSATINSSITPTIQANNIVFNTITTNSISLSWSAGNGTRRVVKISPTTTINNMTDGTDPAANTVYSGSGEQVIYNGTGTSITVTGLSTGVSYTFKVFEANYTGTSSKYLNSSGPLNPNSSIATALPNIDGLEEMKVLPNPTNGQFSVRLKLRTMKEVNFRLINQQGRVIYQSPTYKLIGTTNTPIDIQNQPAGIYNLQITINGKTADAKIVKSSN